MHTLFGKIFVWFFVAQMLISAAMFAVSSATRTRLEPSNENWRGVVTEILLAQSHAAAASYEAGDVSPLKELLVTRPQQEPPSAFLFEVRGDGMTLVEAENARSRVPLELAVRAVNSRRIEWASVDDIRYGSVAIEMPSQSRFVLVREFQRPVFVPFRNLENSALRFLTFLFMMGLVSYGLARYLAAPVRTLRRATHELAEGNLAVRVGPGMGRRRDEMTALGADFDRMASRLEILLKSQSRLLGDISHELRSPLARLTVALDLAESDNVSPEETASYLARIRMESERLNELIGQLLTLNRLENGFSGGMQDGRHRSQNFVPVDLAPLLEDIAADADFEARSSDRAVSLEVQRACSILGDAALLRSAIENVVRNAIRYTAVGSTVEIALHGAAGKEQAALITVRDHGPGVPPETLTHLFRPFYRVADARDRQSGGAGLGLAITHRAVVLHGGTVTASNVEGGGLLIKISLPCSAGR